LKLSCFSSALHYGQSIFEGLKAYSLEKNLVGIFRLDAYAKRFKNSARIMNMPELNENIFKKCVQKYIQSCIELVPQIEGHSLYLRPLMFASDALIKVSSGSIYRFIIMSSIVGPYFNANKVGTSIYCNREFVRAFPKGTGEAKTAANYALSLPALNYAQSLGFDQVLYLDAMKKESIEELGGMNFFMLKDNKIITPPLTGSILSGITRDSILQLAKQINLEFEERSISIEEVLQPENIQGLFATGTAATIAPIIELGYENHMNAGIQKYKYSIDKKIKNLRSLLKDCQQNKNELSSQWLTIIG
jgi:branched-chain amino acid aminotransferase